MDNIVEEVKKLGELLSEILKELEEWKRQLEEREDKSSGCLN